MVHVGGLRSDRRKWLFCFEEAKVILYLVALSEFDQALYEDPAVNRLDESLKLWGDLTLSKVGPFQNDLRIS